MAGDVIATDLSARTRRTQDVLLQRRDQIDARQASDDALSRLAAASAAIDDAWAEGARRVEELQREAERVRDEVRARTIALEGEQAAAVLELADLWPPEDLAALLGVSVEQVGELVRDAETQMAVPQQRTE